MLVLWIVLSVLLVAALGAVTISVRRSRTTRRRTSPTPLVVSTAPQPPPIEVEEQVAGGQPPEIPQPTEAAGPPEYRQRLGKSRGVFAGLRAMRARRAVEASTWEELETTLLRADVGVATTAELLGGLREAVDRGEIASGVELVDALRAGLGSLLAMDAKGAVMDRTLRLDTDDDRIGVWLFVGVNGVGKTTTIGKLAHRESLAGRSVLLAAGDTFRAAAAEQLGLWAERSGSEIVRGAEGGDPSAVVFDAIQRAAARGNDLVPADTAGRLHTKVNLIEELRKIRRVADRPPGEVCEVLLVIDATTGQNGLVQARQFTEAVGVTGIVLTKLDGTAKGGVVIAVQREIGVPVKLIGLGEGRDDLVTFDPERFVDALLEG